MLVRPKRAAVGWPRLFPFHIQPQEPHLTLPRQPDDRTSRAFLTASSSNRSSASAVATRHFIRSRGRILCFGRPSILTPTSSVAPIPFSTHFVSHNRLFSSTPFVMTATTIDGTAIAKKIRERLHAEIEQTQKTNPRYRPSLKIIQGRIRNSFAPT